MIIDVGLCCSVSHNSSQVLRVLYLPLVTLGAATSEPAGKAVYVIPIQDAITVRYMPQYDVSSLYIETKSLLEVAVF